MEPHMISHSLGVGITRTRRLTLEQRASVLKRVGHRLREKRRRSDTDREYALRLRRVLFRRFDAVSVRSTELLSDIADCDAVLSDPDDHPEER